MTYRLWSEWSSSGCLLKESKDPVVVQETESVGCLSLMLESQGDPRELGWNPEEAGSNTSRATSPEQER